MSTNTTILRIKNANLLGKVLRTLKTIQGLHNLIHFCGLVMLVLNGNGDADC